MEDEVGRWRGRRGRREEEGGRREEEGGREASKKHMLEAGVKVLGKLDFTSWR
jgi:hypothetical protein